MQKIHITLATFILAGALTQTSFPQERTLPTDPTVLSAMKKAADAELPVIDGTNLSIDIAAKKLSFYGGEPIEIEITLKNSGASKTRLLLSPVETFYSFEVFGPGKQTTPRMVSSFRRYWVSGESFDISQNRSKSASIILNNAFDMTPVGKYKIKVSKRFRLKESKQEPVTISSNTLTVNVASELPISQWH